jgi:hypothetical protein
MATVNYHWTIALPVELHAFVHLVLENPILQFRLASIAEADAFVAESMLVVAEHDIDLDPACLHGVIRPLPMGLDRFGPPPISCAGWPPPNWLPAHSVTTGAAPDVDWKWFGDCRLLRPFFDDDVRVASTMPFNRIFRIRTTLDSVIAGAETEPSLPLKGLIYHMSRCGSTLLAQMFAAVPENAVSSEPDPLDGVIQWLQLADVEPQLANVAIRAIISALGRDRGNGQRQQVIKLTPWNVFGLPIIRAALPEVNWVYLYRDSVEVMVSVMHRPGLHSVAGLLPDQITHAAGDGSSSQEEYAGQVLAAMGKTVLDHWKLGGGLLVAYPNVAEAATSGILTHFGMEAASDGLALMQTASQRDAKMPDQAFANDAAQKRADASIEMVAVANRLMEPIHYQLIEMTRDSQLTD